METKHKYAFQLIVGDIISMYGRNRTVGGVVKKKNGCYDILFRDAPTVKNVSPKLGFEVHKKIYKDKK